MTISATVFWSECNRQFRLKPGISRPGTGNDQRSFTLLVSGVTNYSHQRFVGAETSPTVAGDNAMKNLACASGLFSDEYAHKTDDELLRLALELDSLTPEARLALAFELRQRCLDSPSRLEQFRGQERQQLHLEETRIGNLTLFVPHGIGKRTYGRVNREMRGTDEEFDTTVFFVLFYFPLIPLGTYRVLRKQLAKSFYVLDRKPLNWLQVLSVWLKSIGFVAAIPLAIQLLIYLGNTVSK